jgi:hypothetical protein
MVHSIRQQYYITIITSSISVSNGGLPLIGSESYCNDVDYRERFGVQVRLYMIPYVELNTACSLEASAQTRILMDEH